MNHLTAQNITRIKNITNGEKGKAYLNLEEKEFILHFPDKRKNSVLEATTNELIVLYQRASKSDSRYLTHLVRPIDDELIEENARENFKFGRIVETISFPGEQNKIPFRNSPLADLDFRNRGWGNAELLSNLVSAENLEKTQQQLWNLFLPFFNNNLRDNQKDYQTFFNDELNQDFETKEGKVLFRNHRVRERDGTITHLKKQTALREGSLKCEVCEFSFPQKYGQEYIECHHITPIKDGERVTKLEDLALVCSNCHRMLHRKIEGDYLSIDELKELMKNEAQHSV